MDSIPPDSILSFCFLILYLYPSTIYSVRLFWRIAGFMKYDNCNLWTGRHHKVMFAFFVQTTLKGENT